VGYVQFLRIRDVLQLEGLRALPGALRTCRMASVACLHSHAHGCCTRGPASALCGGSLCCGQAGLQQHGSTCCAILDIMPPKPLEPGDPLRLGRFELLGRLGEGGQGVVYLGRGATPGEVKVAVKVLRSGADAVVLQRLARELDAIHKVQPFVTARVIEASAEGGRRYVVSEFIDGPSLQERVDALGPLPEGELQRLAVGTAAALTAIHGAAVVHRDFKPSNVLLGPDGPRVVDFGIARLTDYESITSGIVGTPAYMSPEQLAGHKPTSAVDMFAWAGTLIFAATGRPAFAADSVPAVMHRVLYGDPDLSAAPPALLPVLRQCLDKDPIRRPTARDVLLRLLDPTARSSWVTGAGPTTARAAAVWQDSAVAESARTATAARPGNRPVPDRGEGVQIARSLTFAEGAKAARPGHGGMPGGQGTAGYAAQSAWAADVAGEFEPSWRKDEDPGYTGGMHAGSGRIAVQSAAARPGTGRRHGRRNGRRLWLASGGLVAAAAAAITGVLTFGFPSRHGPAHVLVTPARIGAYVRTVNMERQTNVAALRDEVISNSSGRASRVVSAVYESGDPAAGSTTQILMFIGGHLANADPAASITSFTREYPGAHIVSAGSLGGDAACVEEGAGTTDSAALCAWFDNDSFGELVSPTMSDTALAQVMLTVRPHLELPVAK
jgi:Protein kinase domain